MAKKKSKEKGMHAYYMELESPLDLARHIFRDGNGVNIMALKANDSYKLISLGERLGDVRIAYYSNVKKISDIFVYSTESDAGERFELTTASELHSDIRSFKAPIMELLADPYSEAKNLKKAEKVIKAEVKNSYSLVKSIANDTHDEQGIPMLYAFQSKGSHIIGTFDLFHEQNTKVFTYAKFPVKESFGTLAYNYITGIIEPTANFAERSAIYIRIINLKKPFPFF